MAMNSPLSWAGVAMAFSPSARERFTPCFIRFKARGKFASRARSPRKTAPEFAGITPSPTRAAPSLRPASSPGRKSRGECGSSWRAAMRDPVQAFIEDVICYADLAPADERNVRAELAEHLHVLTSMSHISDPKEIYAMLKDQFGNPRIIG